MIFNARTLRLAMVDVRVALLGPPVVERGGLPVTFDTRKAIALLAVLGVTWREHSRERLSALLWPDSDPVRARGSLRRTLSVTAAELGEALVITRSTVQLDRSAARLDVTEFDELIARADADSLRAAVRLYRDDFMAGFALRDCPEFDEWQLAESDRLRQQMARVLERLAAACAASGELDIALEHARRWLAFDQLHEPAHQALIRLLGLTGQRSAALRQYRSLVQVLDRELAVRPLPATTQLYEQVLAGQLEPLPMSSGPVVLAAAEPASALEPVSWPLVGRDHELGVLISAWRQSGRAGRGVAVVGAAGSGKTSLVQELATRIRTAGGTVLMSRCHDGEAALPFVLAGDLLQGALSLCPELPDRLPAHSIAMAGRLVPRLAAGGPDLPAPTLDSPVAVARMYAAIAETLVAAVTSSTGRAGVIVVENVHWADAPSLDLLPYLVRRLADLPILLVITWRPEDASRLRALRAAVGEAAEAGVADIIEPLPLGPAELADLLSPLGLPEADAERLVAETGGLPLLVREYVQALRSVPGDQLADPAWWPTGSVRELLSGRLLTASEPTLQVLTAAAVLGSTCDAELLRTVSGRGEDEIVDALDEALARGLLTEFAPHGERAAPSYGFPYEALRLTAYESATLARRRLLHSRAADALAGRYLRDPVTAAAAIIADHLQQAGRDAESADWWWQAAEQARALYAHADAHAHLTQALALGYPQVRGRVALGEVLIVLGRYAEALGEFETAAAAAAGDRPRLATIEHKLAEVQHRLGNWDLAEAHLRAVDDLLPDDDVVLRARAYADRALVAFRRGLPAEAADLGRAALGAATSAEDAGAMAQALNVLGMAAASAGEAVAAEGFLRQALDQARRVPDPGTEVAALNNLARLLADTGRSTDALAAATAALTAGSELGDQHRLAALHTNLADLLHAAGDQDGAIGHLKEAARRFAAVDPGSAPRPEIWTLVEW